VIGEIIGGNVFGVTIAVETIPTSKGLVMRMVLLFPGNKLDSKILKL
jgi:hypothetical protein